MDLPKMVRGRPLELFMQSPQDGGSLEAAKAVDELCDQFESQCARGKRPRIEDYVSEHRRTCVKRCFKIS